MTGWARTVAIAIATMRVMRALLYGVEASDPRAAHTKVVGRTEPNDRERRPIHVNRTFWGAFGDLADRRGPPQFSSALRYRLGRAAEAQIIQADIER